MEEKYQDAIDEIMDNFDFQKVHTTMKALKWAWAGEGIPEIPSIKKQARRLLKDSLKNKTCNATGGFHVQYSSDENGEYVHIMFVVADWDVEIND